jgi:hypothetical protein
MSVKRIIAGVLLLVVLGLVYMARDKFERITEEIDIGFKGEARSNSLYASRLFLKAMGIPAEKVELYALDNLPATDTVLVINTHRTTLSTARIDKILKWVEQGGHLLTIAAPNYLEEDGYKDALQHKLGVSIVRAYYLTNANKQSNGENAQNEQDETDDDQPSTVSVALAGIDKTYTVAMDSFYPIQSKTQQGEQIQLFNRTFLLNKPYGNGLVSLISDLELIENNWIEEYDHAEFFWQLIHRHHVSPRNVWLLNSDDMPPLWQWLWQYASAFIITLLLLSLLWFFGIAQRFGPLIPQPVLDRRRILEHIQASGYFLWRHDQQQLIQSSRESVQQKFATLFPAWHQLNQQEQLKYASEYSKLSIDELQYLLYEEKKLSADGFTLLIQQLEKLRTG